MPCDGRQGRYKDVTQTLQGRYMDVAGCSGRFRTLQDVTRRYKDVARTLQGHYKDVTRTLQGRCTDVTRTLQGRAGTLLTGTCKDVTLN